MIRDSFPPNYEQIVFALGDVSKHRPVFAYAPDIYNPFKREITKDVEHHELVHIQRQGIYTSPDVWYNSYLWDKDFRLNEERIAYGEQYVFGCQFVTNAKLRKAFLEHLARELCGDAYGNLCTYQQAEQMIRTYGR